MCSPTLAEAPTESQRIWSSELSVDGNHQNVSATNNEKSFMTNGILHRIWPLSPPVALALLAAVVPASCILNRGFTQWFHWAFVMHQLTQSMFLERMLVLSGVSICLGWYAALVYEYVQYDRFCHPLYKNMPSMLTQYMVLDAIDDNNHRSGGTLDFESTASLSAMALSHVLDMLAHPLLTYYYWHCRCRRFAGVDPAAKVGSFHAVVAAQILTWPVIFAAYTYSRVWSLTHTYYNFGHFGFFYVGHDVYLMDDLDSWFPAYVAEGVVFGSIVLWKLFLQPRHFDHYEANRDSNCKATTEVATTRNYETKPSLLPSESSISVETIIQN